MVGGKTVDDMTKVNNRAELSRLIRAHLEERRVRTGDFTSMLEGVVTARSVLKWLSGDSVPGSPEQRSALEKALGWKPGSVWRVVKSSSDSHFELGELRDWSQLDDGQPEPYNRASELSDAELLVELSRRFSEKQNRIELLEGLAGDRQEPKSVFGLAASGTDAARNMEHLEK